ncbi:MAG: T9SS type A sorting domain-containing protein [Bacteroidetes bacterium]|nr:T9SS type A sorting domain-containing protein [Bacteroidota bacterium]
MKQQLFYQNTLKNLKNIFTSLTGNYFLVVVLLITFSIEQYKGQSWTAITTIAPDTCAGVMLLLSDGSVIVKTTTGGGDGIGNTWNKLTPDASGSYINGTWSTIAPMNKTRLYFSSQILKDGRVYVAGGEYGTGKSFGEIYNPITNTWTMTPPPGVVSDANSEILPDGRVLQALVTGSLKTNVIYNPLTNSYSPGPTCLGIHNESSWVKLPDNSFIFIDRLSTNSERYIPSLNSWVADATVPVSLYDPFGDETGPAFLLPDGRAFFIGSTNKTAYYTPSGTNSPGTWSAGPLTPSASGAPDAGGAMMPNGKIICALSPTPTSTNHFPTPTTFYEFDYLTNTFTAINTPLGTPTLNVECYLTNFLDLPDGTILYGQQGEKQYHVYTPSGPQLAAGQPTISNIIQNGCNSFTITGMLFNGIGEGAEYGDDWQMATNYPIVRLNSGTNVYYARTFNWNRTGVQTGTLPDTTQFTLPAGLPQGTYSLVVIANGISSNPVTFIPFPIMNSTLAPAGICSNNLFTYTPSSAVIGASFTWTRPTVAGISNAAITSAQSSNPNEILINTTATPINVIYNYTTTANGCNGVQQVTVTVNPNPLVTVNSATNTICNGDSALITASGAASYVWSNSAATASTTVNPNTTTIYTVTGTNIFNCTNIQQFTVNVNPLPILSISGQSIICVGDSIVLNASGGATYLWSNSSTSPSIGVNPIISTSYSVTGTNTLGCSSVNSIMINVSICTDISSNASGNNSISVFPNPADEAITVTYKIAASGNCDLRLTDIFGRAIKEEQIKAFAGNNSFLFSLEGIAKGIYMLELQNGNTISKIKVVIK